MPSPRPIGQHVVLDAVLLPPPGTVGRLIRVSRELAAYGSEFVLDERDVVPHVSLYMGRFPVEAVPAAVRAVGEVAAGTAPLRLTAQEYGHDTEHGMVEVTFAPSAELTALQDDLVAALAPLRTGLRELDPVGRRLPEWLPTTSGEIRANLDRYGYDEIGSHFRPHVTVTRLRRRDARLPVASLPAPDGFSGQADQLGLYEMGPHGTCVRCVTVLPLTGARQ